MPNIRVIRTLEYTGPEEWVKEVLSKSFIGKHGFSPGPGKIIRQTEIFEDLNFRHADDLSAPIWKDR